MHRRYNHLKEQRPARAGRCSCVLSTVLAHVCRDELCHLEHGHLVLAENDAELVISLDVALIRRILEIMLFDIVPEFLYHFRARKGPLADHRLEFGREV